MTGSEADHSMSARIDQLEHAMSREERPRRARPRRVCAPQAAPSRRFQDQVASVRQDEEVQAASRPESMADPEGPSGPQGVVSRHRQRQRLVDRGLDTVVCLQGDRHRLRGAIRWRPGNRRRPVTMVREGQARGEVPDHAHDGRRDPTHGCDADGRLPPDPRRGVVTGGELDRTADPPQPSRRKGEESVSGAGGHSEVRPMVQRTVEPLRSRCGEGLPPQRGAGGCIDDELAVTSAVVEVGRTEDQVVGRGGGHIGVRET